MNKNVKSVINFNKNQVIIIDNFFKLLVLKNIFKSFKIILYKSFEQIMQSFIRKT